MEVSMISMCSHRTSFVDVKWRHIQMRYEFKMVLFYRTLLI